MFSHITSLPPLSLNEKVGAFLSQFPAVEQASIISQMLLGKLVLVDHPELESEGQALQDVLSTSDGTAVKDLMLQLLEKNLVAQGMDLDATFSVAWTIPQMLVWLNYQLHKNIVAPLNVKWFNNLDGQQLQTLLAIFKALPHITTINLSWNDFGDVSDDLNKIIFEALQGFGELTSLNLFHTEFNKLLAGPEEAILSALGHLSKLTSINLGLNHLSELPLATWKHLFDCLTTLPKLHTLSLIANNLMLLQNVDAWNIFFDALNGMPVLLKLNLSRNQLGALPHEVLILLFRRLASSNLRTLDLSGNHLDQLNDTLWQLFLECLAQSNLTAISLADNLLQEEQVHAVLSIIQANNIKFPAKKRKECINKSDGLRRMCLFFLSESRVFFTAAKLHTIKTNTAFLPKELEEEILELREQNLALKL